MRAFSIAVSSCLFAVCLAGCSFSEPPQEKAEVPQRTLGSVAVVDLDEVAKRLSRDTELATAVAAKEADLNEKLGILKNLYDKQFKKEKELYGSEPKKEDAEKIAALDRQLGIQIREAQRQAQVEIVLFRQSLISRFREQVKPLAREIAAQRGLTIVIAPSQLLLLSVDPRADITDEVVEKMLATTLENKSQTRRAPKVSSLPQRDGEFQQKR